MAGEEWEQATCSKGPQVEIKPRPLLRKHLIHLLPSLLGELLEPPQQRSWGACICSSMHPTKFFWGYFSWAYILEYISTGTNFFRKGLQTHCKILLEMLFEADASLSCNQLIHLRMYRNAMNKYIVHCWKKKKKFFFEGLFNVFINLIGNLKNLKYTFTYRLYHSRVSTDRLTAASVQN